MSATTFSDKYVRFLAGETESVERSDDDARLSFRDGEATVLAREALANRKRIVELETALTVARVHLNEIAGWSDDCHGHDMELCRPKRPLDAEMVLAMESYAEQAVSYVDNALGGEGK